MNSLRLLFIQIFLCGIFSTFSNAQHRLTLNNGTTLEGKIQVLYSTEYQNDFINFTNENGEEQKFNANEIASFTIDYKSFEALPVRYYVFDIKEDVSRTILASNILEGELSLWKYEGFDFSFVLERSDQFFPLQKSSAENGEGDNYKTVLIAQAGDYYSIKVISTFKYSTKSMLNIVNEYNSNRDPNYVPKNSSLNYLQKVNVGGSLGSTLVTNDFSFIHYTSQCEDCPARPIFTVSNANDKTTSISISGFRRWNILNQKNLEFEADFSLQYYSFDITSSSKVTSVTEDITSLEAILSFGPNYKIPLNNRFNTSFSVQPAIYFRLNTMSVYTTVYSVDVYNRDFAQNLGLAMNLDWNIEYELNENSYLFFKTAKTFRNTEAFFIGNMSKTRPGSSVEFKEHIHFSLGFRLIKLK